MKVLSKKYLKIIIALILMGLPLSGWAKAARNYQTIKVGVYNNPPKIFINKQGNPDGFFIDIIKSISKRNNLKIEYITGTWSELFTKLEKGEIDLLPDMAYSKGRDSLFNFSIPVLSSWLQVFTTKNCEINKLDDLQNKRIGVLKGSSQEEYMKVDERKKYHINYSVLAYNSYYSTVVALKKGKIDVIVANRFFYFSDLCNKDIIPTGVILQFSDLNFAFSKTINPALIKLFDKSITSFKNNPNSVYYTSMQKWFNKKKVIIPRYLLWLIILLGLGLIVFLLFTTLLNNRVKAKTKILNKRNEELILAKEKAEKSDRLKTIFLQNMSHEIRTPMNGILGFLDLLKDSNLNNENRDKYIDIINVSGERLLNTMNDIIEMSQIESDHVELQFTAVDIKEIMDFQLDFFTEKAKRKGLVLQISQHLPKENAVIETDKILFNSIMTHLINNAIKFTRRGSVEFGNYLDNNRIVFYVKDTGSGIPEGRKEAIFDRFVNADIKISRSHEGSGLGLSIVKAYVNMLNGEIWLESEVGKGSTFFFSLPYKSVIV